MYEHRSIEIDADASDEDKAAAIASTIYDLAVEVAGRLDLPLCTLSGRIVHFFAMEMALNGHRRCAAHVLERCVRDIISAGEQDEARMH